jgi:predicted NodU family carbamoyl transferase
VRHGCARRGNRLRPLLEIDYRHSLGYLYAAFTVACGFTAGRHEGMVTALAPTERWTMLYRRLAALYSLDQQGSIVGRLNGGLPLGPIPTRCSQRRSTASNAWPMVST